MTFPRANETVVSVRELIAPSFYALHHQIKSGDVREVWAKGGRGSTKSSFVSIEIMLGLIADPQAHAFISRRYDNELRDSVFGQLKWAAKKLHIDHLWDFITSPYEATNKHTKQKIVFRGLDDPDKARSFNPGFGYVKYFWAEEVNQFGGMEDVRNILQSLFRGEGDGQVAFFTFNPPKSARSWVNAEVKISKPGRVVHHSTYLDVNPSWLGEVFLANAEHSKKTTPDAYRHEYMGEEIGTGLEVFNNIELRNLDDEECAALINIRQGLDWGYAADPIWFGRMSYDRKRRHLTIFGEISGIGISNRKLNEMAPEEWKRQQTRPDSSEPKSIDDMKNEYGWNMLAATKGPGSVETGLKWLSDLERITIDPTRCPLAAFEFVNYALEIGRDGQVKEGYPDKNNHSIDGTRYGLEDVMKPEPKVVRAAEPQPMANHWR